MISLEAIRRAIDYNHETGAIIARTRRANGKVKVGSILGSVRPDGYLMVTFERRRILAHRLAWFYTTGEWPDEIDHVNADRSDNRLCNLRVATRRQNGANLPRQTNNTSGFKGVSFHKRAGKWRADIKVNYRPIYLGLFATREDAHAAYCAAATRYFGEFARAA